MRPFVEPLESRDLPAPSYHGGPLVAHVVLDNVFVGEDRPEVRALEATLVHEYLDLLAPYGVGEGRVGASVTIPGLGPLVTDDALRGVLATLVAQGRLPAPDGSQVYAVFTAPGVVIQAGSELSDRDFAGYHDAFLCPAPGKLPPLAFAPYAVLPYESRGGSDTLSHELAEAVTDPLPGTGWYDDAAGNEVADVYQGRTGGTLNGYPVAVLCGPAGEELTPGPASRALALWNLAVAQVAYRTLELRAGRGLATAPACLDALDAVLGNPLVYTHEGLRALAQADLYALLVVRPAL